MPNHSKKAGDYSRGHALDTEKGENGDGSGQGDGEGEIGDMIMPEEEVFDDMTPEEVVQNQATEKEMVQDTATKKEADLEKGDADAQSTQAEAKLESGVSTLNEPQPPPSTEGTHG